MNHLVYQYSLCAALSLMTFFSLYFLLTRTPEKPIFKDYFLCNFILIIHPLQIVVIQING